ncbi:MAG TPA: FecR domain-containing protein [Anaerohalosphaeraceae bacterium]|nr:FecR domain-containing protein [Anaerohalosphaeraceae bacterium]
MKDTQKQLALAELIQKELDGCLTDQEFTCLQTILKENPEAVDYYVKTICVISNISSNSAVLETVQGNSFLTESFQSGIWKALADAEKTAPAVAFKAAQMPRISVEKVRREKAVRKVSKSAIVSFLTAAAAVLFVILFARFAPPKGGYEVATLADGIGAEWAAGTSVQKGSRFVTGSSAYMLKEGLAELLFDNAARLTIEAPAEFRILGDDRLRLEYGRLYASVPPGAVGFTVNTPSARIIDLGTEFGVQSDFDGNTQLHVLKGKTVLMAGAADKTHLEVSAGAAKKIAKATGEVTDIPCQSDYFVRTINSASNCVWRGQNRINLADIVGGGNGLGTGTLDMMIDPASGKPSKESWGRRQASNDYHPVPSNPYIDGVFVPNGRSRQIVSSEGHLFQDCPVTCGLTCDSLVNAQAMLDWLADSNAAAPETSVSVLLLHSNMGITFDLQAIRNLLPGAKITRFQSKCGMRKWAVRSSASNADFWILVDGKLRHKQTQVKANSIFDIDIALSDSDRFLTLVETDGGDPDERIFEDMILVPIDSDWGMFIEPVLILK